MNQKAWGLLIGLLILSLFVAGFTSWFLHRPLRPLPGLPVIGPAYGIPLQKKPLPTRTPLPEPAPSRVAPPTSRVPKPPLRVRIPVQLPWNRPLFLRPRPVWQVGRVLATEIFFFLVAAIALFIFPHRFARCVQAANHGEGTWLPLSVGFMSSITMTILSILAVLSALGLILLPWLLLLFGFVWVMGLSVAALYLGYKIRRGLRILNTPWPFDLAVGVIALVTVGILPFVGWIAFLLIGMWGMGIVILTRFGSEQGWPLTLSLENEE